MVPDVLGLGVIAPGLDAHGHSTRKVAVCRELSSSYGLHVFAHATANTLGGREDESVNRRRQ